MEGKHAVVTVMVVMMTVSWGLMIPGAKANVGEGCLERCLEGCKHGGISPLRCFKYCEKHCGSPSASAPGHRYCNLGCMLEKCSKLHDDEAKEEACALDCKHQVCKPAHS